RRAAHRLWRLARSAFRNAFPNFSDARLIPFELASMFSWGREGQCGSLPKLATCWLATAVVTALKLRSLHSSSQHRLTPLWEQISLATRSETLLRERSPKMRQIQVGNIREAIVERADYPPERLRAILEPETVAVLGYGV